MAKKEETKSTLVAGVFQGGSAMGVLYELMADGKNHTLGTIKSKIGKMVKNVPNRVSLLHRTGKANGKWFVSKDGDNVKLVFGKFKAAEKKEKSSSKPAAKSSKKKAAKSEKKGSTSSRPKVQDVPVEED